MSKAAELAALIGSGQAQGNKNIVINGAMNISQRSTSVTGNTAGGYLTCDRINFVQNMGTWTVIQSSDAPSSEGFLNAYRIDCTTADTSVAATDYLAVQQKIEGQNLQTLRKGTSSAKSVTLSFFVKSNTTGNFVIELYDNDNARQISALYTISSANTWEKKTVTFAGDTSGAFDDDNAESLQINWWLGAGSNYASGTLNTSWASATTANRAAGTQNLAASTDNDWAITGIQFEIGDVATAFEHEDFGTTLRKCKRYYEILDSDIYPSKYSSSSSIANYLWTEQKRADPTITADTNSGSHGLFVTHTSGGYFYKAAENYDHIGGVRGDAEL